MVTEAPGADDTIAFMASLLFLMSALYQASAVPSPMHVLPITAGHLKSAPGGHPREVERRPRLCRLRTALCGSGVGSGCESPFRAQMGQFLHGTKFAS